VRRDIESPGGGVPLLGSAGEPLDAICPETEPGGRLSVAAAFLGEPSPVASVDIDSAIGAPGAGDDLEGEDAEGAPAGDELEALFLRAPADAGVVAAILSGDSSEFIPWRPVLAMRAPVASSSSGAVFDEGGDEAVGDCGEGTGPSGTFFAVDSAMAFPPSDVEAFVDDELSLETGGREAAALAVFTFPFVDSACASAKSFALGPGAATLEGLFSNGVAEAEVPATSLGIDGARGAPAAGGSGSLPRCSRTRIS
jgi:hypothetical protein